MKNISTLLFACLLLVLTSCEKEELIPQDSQLTEEASEINNPIAGKSVLLNNYYTDSTDSDSDDDTDDTPEMAELCLEYPELIGADAIPFVVSIWNGNQLSYVNNPCYEGSMTLVTNIDWEITTVNGVLSSNDLAQIYWTTYNETGSILSLLSNADLLWSTVTITVTYSTGETSSATFTVNSNGQVGGDVNMCNDCPNVPACPSCGGSAVATVILPVKG